MGVQFSTEIAGLDIQLGLVNETDDLNVGGGTCELETLECTLGDETGSTTGLGAPGDSFTLGVCDR